jgi:DNA polymerase (family 10)
MFTSGALPGAVDNRQASRTVFAVASLLESLGANPYRVRAYRRAALGMLRLPVQAERFLDAEGELALPWLGPRLRRKLGELLRRGRMEFYDQLLDELPPPVRELLSVPGVGPVTAARLIEQLGVRSVADLAEAACEGRLQTLRGIGAVREAQLGAAAASILAAQAETSARPNRPPSVGAAAEGVLAAQGEASARPNPPRSIRSNSSTSIRPRAPRAIGGAAEGLLAVREGQG